MFWRRFEKRFGPPGEQPSLYWDAAIGHFAHVGPRDIAFLTPAQLMGCADIAGE